MNSLNCSGCGEAITGGCLSIFELHYHPTCLACYVCGRDFSDNGTVHEGPDGYAYCKKDFLDTFAPKCGGCKEPIQGEVIDAIGKKWHPEHFVCGVCKTKFPGTFFPGQDGVPYCEKHYYEVMGLLCFDCEKPILGGKAVSFLDKKYHPEHFKCSHCKKNLVGNKYNKKNNKPYCEPCFIALFG